MVKGVAGGKLRQINKAGQYSEEDGELNDKIKLLVDEFGYSEEIARRIPADLPTPPPPGSKTATEQGLQ